MASLRALADVSPDVASGVSPAGGEIALARPNSLLLLAVFGRGYAIFMESGFGAAGSLVVLLVWVYFAAQTFLLGAEFTWAYAHERGSQAELSGQRPAAECRRPL